MDNYELKLRLAVDMCDLTIRNMRYTNYDLYEEGIKQRVEYKKMLDEYIEFKQKQTTK